MYPHGWAATKPHAPEAEGGEGAEGRALRRQKRSTTPAVWSVYGGVFRDGSDPRNCGYRTGCGRGRSAECSTCIFLQGSEGSGRLWKVGICIALMPVCVCVCARARVCGLWCGNAPESDPSERSSKHFGCTRMGLSGSGSGSGSGVSATSMPIVGSMGWPCTPGGYARKRQSACSMQTTRTKF